MRNLNFAAGERRSEPILPMPPLPSTTKMLVARPRGFFSTSHTLTLEEHDENGRVVSPAQKPSNAVQRALGTQWVAVSLFVVGSTLLGWAMS